MVKHFTFQVKFSVPDPEDWGVADENAVEGLLHYGFKHQAGSYQILGEIATEETECEYGTNHDWVTWEDDAQDWGYIRNCNLCGSEQEIELEDLGYECISQ